MTVPRYPIAVGSMVGVDTCVRYIVQARPILFCRINHNYNALQLYTIQHIPCTCTTPSIYYIVRVSGHFVCLFVNQFKVPRETSPTVTLRHALVSHMAKPLKGALRGARVPVLLISRLSPSSYSFPHTIMHPLCTSSGCWLIRSYPTKETPQGYSCNPLLH